MWFAIVILSLLSAAGWFLYGISCGEAGKRSMLDKMPPPDPRTGLNYKVGPNPFE